MGYEIPGKRITLIAGADLSAARYKAAVIDANGAAVVAGADAVIAGVIQLPDTAGHTIPVMIDGVSQVLYGGVVAAGDKLSTDAAGKFIKATAGPIVGIALEAGTAGIIGTALLR